MVLRPFPKSKGAKTKKNKNEHHSYAAKSNPGSTPPTKWAMHAMFLLYMQPMMQNPPAKFFLHSLSLALPVAPSSSSSWTTSLPAVMANSAFCKVFRSEELRGSTSSRARSLALLRILHNEVHLSTWATSACEDLKAQTNSSSRPHSFSFVLCLINHTATPESNSPRVRAGIQ